MNVQPIPNMESILLDFENQWSSDPHPDISYIFPSRDHADFSLILSELVRTEMELRNDLARRGNGATHIRAVRDS